MKKSKESTEGSQLSPEMEYIEEFKQRYEKAVAAARVRHKIMNYHYLQYKGISYLNQVYGKDYIESIGLQVNVPRTFATVESVRSEIVDRKLDIDAGSFNKSATPYKAKAVDMLKGEWARSKAKHAKADCQFDALVFGTGFGLSKYTENVKETEIFDGYDNDGKIITKKGLLERYKGMTLTHLNPFYVFRDPRATTNEVDQPGAWTECFVYSVWDFDDWMEVCEEMDFNVSGMEVGGNFEEFDRVRRIIDNIYSTSDINKRNANNEIVSKANDELEEPDWSNSIVVVERFEEDRYSICSGPNWTLNHKDNNPNPDKTIPIIVFRDISIPNEFEGIGEPEILRWQQYEENKVHNLSYMNVLLNSVQRFGIVKEWLVDPTSVKMSNPLKPIYIKPIMNKGINDAIQPLNQGKGTSYPKDFLAEVKANGQMATGITDFAIGANKAITDTATEADKLSEAANKRINRKIHEMDSRDLVPMLLHWLACIPQYYDEDLDLRVTANEEYFAKFIPYVREFNDNPAIVAEYATKEGVQRSEANTIEKIFLAKGYKNVVFVSDILNRFDIEIKTVMSRTERLELQKEFREVIAIMEKANADLQARALPPKYDTASAMKKLLELYPEVIDNAEDYILQNETMTPPALPQIKPSV